MLVDLRVTNKTSCTCEETLSLGWGLEELRKAHGRETAIYNQPLLLFARETLHSDGSLFW